MSFSNSTLNNITMGRVKVDRDSCIHNHALHYGSGLPVFRGEIRQDSFGIGNLLGSLIRQAIPVLKPMVKSLACTSLKTGGWVLSDVVDSKKSCKDAVKDRFIESVDNTLMDRKSRGRKKVTRKRRRIDILD